MIEYMYWIRMGLAGSLQNYSLTNAAGRPATGRNIMYNGSPAGYTLDPQESINYVSAHDNETLFDAIQLKAGDDASIGDRVRMQNLALSLVMLGQGVPFFHAGSDMLRSKSLDRNSYNSGDWFNRLDFTYQTNNWGVGLPPAGDNQSNWHIMRGLLGNPDLKPTQADILNNVTHFQDMLRIRKSSKLFRLETAEEIKERLYFLNTGPDQIPGLIVMALTDTGPVDLDPGNELIVVLFNANRAEQTFSFAALQGIPFRLHPIQAASNDPVVREARFDAESGTFTAPGRTTAVFVTDTAPEGIDLTAPAAEPTATPAPTPTATAAPTAVPTAATAPVTPEPAVEQPAPSNLALPILIVVAVVVAVGALLVSRRRKPGA
jgi:pullulanase-type alpha-1,6-glucosidase